MKMFIVMLSVFATLSANAGVVLQCTTPGDALNDVQLIDNGAKAPTLNVSFLDDSVVSMVISSSLKNIKAGDSDTLIAAKDLDNVFGGGIADAALLRVLPGQKSARLAMNGMVYILNCYK